MANSLSTNSFWWTFHSCSIPKYFFLLMSSYLTYSLLSYWATTTSRLRSRAICLPLRSKYFLNCFTQGCKVRTCRTFLHTSVVSYWAPSRKAVNKNPFGMNRRGNWTEVYQLRNGRSNPYTTSSVPKCWCIHLHFQPQNRNSVFGCCNATHCLGIRYFGLTTLFNTR